MIPKPAKAVKQFTLYKPIILLSIISTIIKKWMKLLLYKNNFILLVSI